jgi:hypothetical protein
MARKAGSRSIVPLIRGGFLTALKNLERKGVISGMADIWEQIIAEDPAKALELLAKYVPREMLVEVDDARPFAFVAEPLTPIEWQRRHAQRALEHDSGDDATH